MTTWTKASSGRMIAVTQREVQYTVESYNDGADDDDIIRITPDGKIRIRWQELPVGRPVAADYRGQTYLIRRRANGGVDISKIVR